MSKFFPPVSCLEVLTDQGNKFQFQALICVRRAFVTHVRAVRPLRRGRACGRRRRRRGGREAQLWHTGIVWACKGKRRRGERSATHFRLLEGGCKRSGEAKRRRAARPGRAKQPAGAREREKTGGFQLAAPTMAEKRRASPCTVLSLKAHAFSVEALIGAEKQQQQPRQSQQQPPPQKRRKLAGANGEETPSEGSGGGGHGNSCDTDSGEGAGQSASSPSGAEICSAAPEVAKNCGAREVPPGKSLRPLAFTAPLSA